MKVDIKARLPLVLASMAAFCLALNAFWGEGEAASAAGVATFAAQDVSNLDRRISQLEQRLYSIESGLNRLEQQTALAQRSLTPSTSNSTRDTSISLLQAEVEMHTRRLAEIECALVRLDQRTASTAARTAGNATSAGGRTDPCRLDPERPVRLSTKP